MAKPQFNRKIAKQIAENSVCLVLDCILGISDYDYCLGTPSEIFEQNFEEDMQEIGINPTERRVRVCREEYDKIIAKIKKPLQKYYN